MQGYKLFHDSFAKSFIINTSFAHVLLRSDPDRLPLWDVWEGFAPVVVFLQLQQDADDLVDGERSTALNPPGNTTVLLLTTY